MVAGRTQRHPIQVNPSTYDSIRTLSQETGLPMTKIVERAVERLRHEMILRAHNEAWSNLMINDPEAIEAFKHEETAWDQTVGDGIFGE